MNFPAQIDGGSSKRNWIIPFKNSSYRQKMISKPQIHHKSPPRPNSGIIPNSFDIKKTRPTSQHPQNYSKTPKSNWKITKKRVDSTVVQTFILLVTSTWYTQKKPEATISDITNCQPEEPCKSTMRWSNSFGNAAAKLAKPDSGGHAFTTTGQWIVSLGGHLVFP